MKTKEQIKKAGKKVAMKNYSLKVFSSFAEEFDEMCGKAAGNKGEQLSAGLMAYMGLYEIDKGIVSALMNPDIDRHQAAALILESIKKVIFQKAFDCLTPEQQASLLRDAEQSRDKVLRKK